MSGDGKLSYLEGPVPGDIAAEKLKVDLCDTGYWILNTGATGIKSDFGRYFGERDFRMIVS